MMRAGYTTTARLFRDSDETAEIKWYECAPGAKVLGFPSLLRPLDWQSHPYLYSGGKGEVYLAPKRYRRNLPLPGALGRTVCGTRRDFEEGGVYDPVSPPYPRRSDGLALCCAGEPGGLLWGGFDDLGVGGLLWSGTAVTLGVTTSGDCTDPGHAVIPHDGLTRKVSPNPFVPSQSRFWIVAAQADTGTVRIRYQGFQPGTVRILAMNAFAFCTLSSQLFEGDADSYVDFEATATAALQIVVAVVCDPDPIQPIHISVTPVVP
jgi:hypothetical protein